jgi:acyl carrier protein
MKRDDAESMLRTALREIAPDADLSSLAPNADLRQTLGLDSLDFLQLVEVLSERSGHRIDEEDYPRLATLTDSVAYLSGPG